MLAFNFLQHNNVRRFGLQPFYKLRQTGIDWIYVKGCNTHNLFRLKVIDKLILAKNNINASPMLKDYKVFDFMIGLKFLINASAHNYKGCKNV